MFANNKELVKCSYEGFFYTEAQSQINLQLYQNTFMSKEEINPSLNVQCCTKWKY